MRLNEACAKAVRVRGFYQVLCRNLFVDGKEPVTMMERAQACCIHQYFCPQTQRFENTPGARKCPKRLEEKGRG